MRGQLYFCSPKTRPTAPWTHKNRAALKALVRRRPAQPPHGLGKTTPNLWQQLLFIAYDPPDHAGRGLPFASVRGALTWIVLQRFCLDIPSPTV
ncbi:hypothetical protein ACFLR7_03385 [Acidobacteriota bacterium]